MRFNHIKGTITNKVAYRYGVLYSLPDNTSYLYNMNSLQSPVTCLITFGSITVLRSRLNKYYSFLLQMKKLKH